MDVVRLDLPAKNLDHLLKITSEIVQNIALTEKQAEAFAEVLKVFAGEYARLLEEGKIPPNRKYTFDEEAHRRGKIR